MAASMLKRKTRKWPCMFGQRRKYKSIPLQDCLTLGGDKVYCVSDLNV